MKKGAAPKPRATKSGGPPQAKAPRTRLAPDARRDQILETALRLFGEHGYNGVSASDIARAAGVTPALVHHYFGPKRQIYLAAIDLMRATVVEGERPGPDVPVEERLRRNLDVWMDWVDANRELWLATAGLGDLIPDPEVLATVTAAREQAAEALIADYPDLVDDSPEARFALLSWMGLNQAALRRWLRGDASREQTHELLVHSLLAMLRDVIPALQADSAQS
jgi:AcrR family transcriptional regulator